MTEENQRADETRERTRAAVATFAAHLRGEIPDTFASEPPVAPRGWTSID